MVDEQQQKAVRLFLTDDERREACNVLLKLTGEDRVAVQLIINRLLEHGEPMPSEVIQQTVFEDLLDQYGDYSTKEFVREILADWAPTDYSEHISYMAYQAAEDDAEGEEE